MTRIFVIFIAAFFTLVIAAPFAVPPNPFDYDANDLHKLSGQPLPEFPEWFGQPGSLRQKVTGTGFAVAVLIEFPDHTYNPTHPNSNYVDLIFSDDTYPTGSVRDWYQVNSYGQYDLEGGVYGWYTTLDNYNYNYNDQNYGLSWGGRAVALKAAELSDPVVDFGQYDNDGADGIPNSGDDDGYVDLFFVFHAGPCGSQTGNVNDIWSHKWSISYTTDDACANGGNIRISDYAIQPEENPDESMVTIGVVCHEMGHVLGLPDLYDTDPTYGIGFWGAMSYGVHGGDGQHRYSPVHFSAWSKEQLGWVTPTIVTNNLDDVLFEPVEENQVIYKVWRDGSPEQEYFLIENRQRLDFDQYLMGTGLLIWHIDNTEYIGYDIVDLEEADGNDDLDHRNNKGDYGDPYPGKSDATDFSPTSYPVSDDNDGVPTYVTIDDFQTNGLNMTCDIMIGSSGVDDGEDGNLPVTYALHPSYPNPSKGPVTISFALPETVGVDLSVYDIKGRKVVTLVNDDLNAGEHTVNVSGLSSGVYLYELRAGGFADTKKMVVE